MRIDPIDEHSRNNDRVEVAQNYMNRPEDDLKSDFEQRGQSELGSAQNANNGAIASNNIPGDGDMIDKLGGASASAERPENINTVAENNPAGMIDNDGDGIDDRVQVSSQNPHATPTPAINEAGAATQELDAADQAMLAELLKDSDGDGIIDILDQTGNDSQIKQWYDEEGKELSPEQLEFVRAFQSLLMKMFGNLDLTNSAGNLNENGNNSVTAMAEGGRAQRAIMQTDSPQAKYDSPVPTKQTVKEAIEEWKKLDQKEKRSKVMNLAGIALSPGNATLGRAVIRDAKILRGRNNVGE